MKTFLTAEWKNLLMLNFETDISTLTPYLPPGTEADDYHGKFYVSIVGFHFRDTKLKCIAIPFHQNFEELNLRFYVRFKENNQWKRGVVFIKEIVPKKMIAWVANTVYGEHYTCLPMKHLYAQDGDNIHVSYNWHFLKEWSSISAVAKSKTQIIQPESFEEFITEHYWGYAKINQQTTTEYQVDHPRWQLHPLQSYQFHCNFIRELYGNDFFDCLSQKPFSVFLANGSPVKVFDRKLLRY